MAEAVAGAPVDGNGRQATMSALDKLKKARELARTSEIRDLEGRRFDLEEVIGKTEEPGQSKFISYIRNFTLKKIIIIASLGIGVPALIFIGLYVRSAMMPSYILSQYEMAITEGRTDEAIVALDDYLQMRPDDWELTADLAELLIITGNFSAARNEYAKLTTRSPLAGEFDILFLSALSNLPRLGSTKGKIQEVLVSNGSYIPALLASALLETQDFELANTNIDKAISELASLRQGGEIYKRYEGLVAIFITSLCSTDDPFQKSLSPDFSLYPLGLGGNDLFIYGLDTSFKTDICIVVPEEGYQSPPDLGAILYAIKTLISIWADDYETAIQSIAQSTSIQSMPLNSYIDALLLSFTGDFQKADSAFLRVGLETAPEVLIGRNIVKMLRGPEHWDTATDLLDAAVREQPNNAQALNNRAVSSMLNGRYGQANSDLEEALSFQSFYVYAVYNQAIVLLLSGDPEGALNKFNSLGGSEDIFPGIKYYVALSYSYQGDADKAVALWRDSLSEPGYGSLSNLALGDIYSLEPIGFDTATNYYMTALAIDPENHEAALKLARMKALQGNTESALRDIEKVEEELQKQEGRRNFGYFMELVNATKGEVMFWSESPGTLEVLAEAFENTNDTELYKKITDLYTRQLLREDKQREALDATRIALPTDPTDVKLLLSRARALAAFNDITEALEIIGDAESMYPEDFDLLKTKASVLAKDQRWDEAVDTYLQAFEVFPSDVSPLEEAIALLERVQPDSERIAEINLMLERKNYQPGADVLSENREAPRVVLNEQQAREIKSEIEELDGLIEDGTVKPFSGNLYRGYLYAQLNNTTEAIVNYQAAAEFSDEDPEKAYQAWQGLANSYMLTGQFPEALEALDKALELGPPPEEEITLFLSRAGIKERVGLPNEAIADYDLVTENFPNYTLPYMRRGLIHMAANEPEKAIENFSVIISIEPENLKAYRARYNAYTLVGDSSNASQDAKTISLLEQKAAAASN